MRTVLMIAALAMTSAASVRADVAPPSPAADATAANKAIVTAMFQKMFIDKQVGPHAEVYFAPDFTEHDPGSRNGTQALKAFFEEYTRKHPQAVTSVRRVLGDGNLAAVYFHVQDSPTDQGIEGVDIFRIVKGKIVEHWDVVQRAGPEQWRSDYTATQPNPAAALTAANKALVTQMFRRLFVEKHVLTEAQNYLAADFIEHNPGAANGVEGLKAYFVKSFKQYPRQSTELKRVLVDGDFAMVNFHYKSTPEERGYAGVDIFRLANGKIAEHWDVVQPVPEKSLNDNTMF